MNQIALTLVIVSAFLLPYVVVFLRRRFSDATPQKSYAPHLIFLCTLRFAPMFDAGVPSAAATMVAFLQVLVIWAIGVSLNEWLLKRHLHRGA